MTMTAVLNFVIPQINFAKKYSAIPSSIVSRDNLAHESVPTVEFARKNACRANSKKTRKFEFAP